MHRVCIESVHVRHYYGSEWSFTSKVEDCDVGGEWVEPVCPPQNVAKLRRSTAILRTAMSIDFHTRSDSMQEHGGRFNLA